MPRIPLIGSFLRQVGSLGLGYGIGGGISGAVEPLVQEARNRAWQQHPALPLDPQTAAQAAVEGAASAEEMRQEASLSGLSASRFDVIRETTERAPSPEQVLEALRRGLASEQDLDLALRKAHLPSRWRRMYDGLRRVLLSPETLAAGRQQGFVTAERQIQESVQQGLTREDAEVLAELAGDPPGVETALMMLRRRIITEQEFRRIVAEGRTKTKYTDQLLKLRRVLPSVSDLIRFAVREVFSPESRRRLQLDADYPQILTERAAELGLDEEDARAYWAAHWELPSPTQAYEMLHRGLITREELDLLLKAADYAPTWRAKLAAISYRVPTRVDVRRAYAAGVISREQVTRMYLDAGYSPDNAQWLTEWTVGQKTRTEKDLTKAEVVALYEARTIPEDRARSMLQDLGYDKEEAGMILSLADYRRAKRMRDREIAAIRAGYVRRRVSEQETVARLDRLGVPAAERDDLLQLWDLEREATERELSLAQLRQVLRRGIRDEQWVRARLEGMGYDREEVDILVALFTA